MKLRLLGLLVLAMALLSGADHAAPQASRQPALDRAFSAVVTRDEIERKVRDDAGQDFHATTMVWCRVDEVTADLVTSRRPDHPLVWVATAHGYFLYITTRLDGAAVISEGRAVFFVYDARTGQQTTRENPCWPVEVIPGAPDIPSAGFVTRRRQLDEPASYVGTWRHRDLGPAPGSGRVLDQRRRVRA